MKKSQMSLLSHQFVSPKKTFEIEDVLGFSTEQPKGITNTNSLWSSKEDKHTKVLVQSVVLKNFPHCWSSRIKVETMEGIVHKTKSKCIRKRIAYQRKCLC